MAGRLYQEQVLDTSSAVSQNREKLARILVAVSTTRRPKVEALREAIESFRPMLTSGGSFEIAAVDVASGVRHTPLSREELMAGARHRGEEVLRIARERREPWKYFVGLEGGLDVVAESGQR